MTVRLVPLDCPACGSAMRGDHEDSVFLCAHCGSGCVIDDQRLVPVPSTAMMPAPGRRAQRWLPGWAIECRVTVAGRTTADGRTAPTRSDRRRFVVPAFPLPLTDLTRLARALSEVAGATGEVPHEPLPGGRLHVDDAVVIVRHLVVGEEVGRPDLLASVAVQLDHVEHRLVALPFEVEGERLRCAVTGVSVASTR